MNNIFKFSIGIFSTLAFCLASLCDRGRNQFGDLEPTSSYLNDDKSIPEGEELSKEISGLAQQGAKEYVSLGCTTCHTQQVR